MRSSRWAAAASFWRTSLDGRAKRSQACLVSDISHVWTMSLRGIVLLFLLALAFAMYVGGARYMGDGERVAAWTGK